MLPWILNVTATWDHYGRLGGNWSLRAPDYITGSACDILSAFESEDVLELEKFMDRHGVSPWAEFTLSNWSLVNVGPSLPSITITILTHMISWLLLKKDGTSARCL